MEAVILHEDLLVERVTDLIHQRTGRMVRALRVHLQDEQAILMGLSPTYYYKQLCSHVAMEELPGYRIVNEIQVI